MQIFPTINSIIRLKLSYEMNIHFPPATYIFQHTYPYRIIDNIFMQFFSAIFYRHRPHFSTSIKCIQHSLLLIENYSQVIFYEFLQFLTWSYSILHAHCIHGYISPQNVSWCRIVKLNVELSEPTFPFHTNIIPLNQKSKQKLFTKLRQNLHNYYIILHLKCQELFIASFPIIRHWLHSTYISSIFW